MPSAAAQDAAVAAVLDAVAVAPPRRRMPARLPELPPTHRRLLRRQVDAAGVVVAAVEAEAVDAAALPLCSPAHTQCG